MMETTEIRCKGRVQGVFFRASSKSRAMDLGIKGWVKNEANGDVLIHAQGEPDKMKAFIEWCHSGPEFSKVSTVETRDLGMMDAYQNFDIRY
jgi:acylphosphatase